MNAAEVQMVCELLLDVRHYMAVMWDYLPDVIKQGMAATHTMMVYRIDTAIDSMLYIAPDDTLKMKAYAMRSEYGY